MKKFQFRLQRLLWYHEQRKKQAEVQLQQVAWQRESAKAEVDGVLQQITNTCRLSEAVGQPISVAARQNAALHLELLRQTLTVAEEKLKSADQRFREAQGVCAEITREVEGLVQLRSQQKIEHQDEVNRQQQIMLDEVVMRQWSTRDADAMA